MALTILVFYLYGETGNSIANPQIGTAGCGTLMDDQTAGVFLDEKKDSSITYTYSVHWKVRRGFLACLGHVYPTIFRF